MCGIIGVLSNHEAAPLLVEALKRLEYRGYDSAGIATVNAGRLDRLVARATARHRAGLVSQCQRRTSERSWCAVPAEQTSIDGIEGLSIAVSEARYRSPLEAHHGHGPSAVRRQALRDCPLART